MGPDKLVNFPLAGHYHPPQICPLDWSCCGRRYQPSRWLRGNPFTFGTFPPEEESCILWSA